MSYLEELIDVIYQILKYTIITSVVLLLVFVLYKQYHNLNRSIVTDTVVEKTIDNRPSYEYLKSVTVYIVHKMGIDEKTHKMEAAIGTGTVVKEVDNSFYILTNKHVCGNETENPDAYTTDKENCYISVSGDPKFAFLKLTYVRSAKDGIDLELWKIDSALLPDKKVVKGFNIAHIQDNVYSVGQYLAIPFIYSEGTMAGYEKNAEIYNIPSAPGCSGSGIFNKDGQIIAVLFAGNVIPPFQMDTAKAIAVSGLDVQEFVEK